MEKYGDVEFATLNSVDFFNKRRLMERLDYIPPDEFENIYFNQIEQQDKDVVLT